MSGALYICNVPMEKPVKRSMLFQTEIVLQHILTWHVPTGLHISSSVCGLTQKTMGLSVLIHIERHCMVPFAEGMGERSKEEHISGGREGVFMCVCVCVCTCRSRCESAQWETSCLLIPTLLIYEKRYRK